MSISLLIGDDPVLLSEAVTARVDELVAEGDRSLMLEVISDSDHFDEEGNVDATRLVVAGGTPPFLTDRRVVVGRAMARFSRKDLYSPIVQMIASLLDSTDLVLVWERPSNAQTSKPERGSFPSLPKALREAVELAGGLVTDTRPPRGKAASNWLRDRLDESRLNFDRTSFHAVENLLGEDRSAVVGLVRTLEGVLGDGADVTPQDVETYGGTRGSVAPWDLDDAIDTGDVAAAIAVVHRLIPLNGSPTDRNTAAFRLLAYIQRRYLNMLRLDGAGVRNDREAADVLGMKGSTYPAKKVLVQSRRLGYESISDSIRLIAAADLSLRGTKDWGPELVIELLVARLTRIARRR